jgi:hypothetical protein
MPTTEDLTQVVVGHGLNGYALHSDGRYYKTLPSQVPAEEINKLRPDIGLLLDALKRHCEDYFLQEGKQRSVNYEDLYFAANQLHEHLQREYENPIIEPFARIVMSAGSLELTRHDTAEALEMVCNYIRDVVDMELRRSPAGMDHLRCLVDAVRSSHVVRCEVFTLNHDPLIERVLDREGIPYQDGFGRPDRDVAWWDPALLSLGEACLLVKLHGSVNWAWYGSRLAKVLTEDADHARVRSGTLLDCPGRSQSLLGTFNKIRDYFSTPYYELFSRFRSSLPTLDCVVVSGYSFGDKGVNSLLCNWVRSCPEARLLVLHQFPDDCLQGGRGAIRKLWKEFRNRRFFTHGEFLTNCDWATLFAVLRRELRTPS